MEQKEERMGKRREGKIKMRTKEKNDEEEEEKED